MRNRWRGNQQGDEPVRSYEIKKKRMKPVDIVTTCKIYSLRWQAQISYYAFSPH